ncbi:MAG TPA: BREX-3 system P-loop-containing protein BrxF [Sulfurovum sp.]|nr:BREX-3 system P-loop-containing protein BrxF [Sulfurovum sp.]
MIKKILDAINTSADMYYRLILLVDEKADHEQLAKEISARLDVEAVNVNLELSKRLLSQTSRQRKLYLSKSMNEVVQPNKTILLDQVEILFDVELGQDPLRLLESLSRNQTIIAFWNGQVRDGKLIYAEQGHPEYRSYDSKDLLMIEINKDKVEI